MVGYIKLKDNPDVIPNTFRKKGKTDLDKDRIVFSDEHTKNFGQHRILLKGKISKLFCKDLDLHEYFNRQEELIFKIHKKYGNSFVNLIDGYFLIFIYDEKKKSLKIYNNPYEATNFYYYLDGNILIFANNLKRLLNNLSFKPKFDYTSIPNFLTTGFSFTEKTEFKNIFRLLPSFIMSINKGKVSFDNYWKTQFKFQRKPFGNIEKHLDKYEQIFRQSIKDYLNCVKPKELGCFLSGGHDTTFVYLQASKIFKKPIHTFTASFENFGFDESPKSKAITEKFGGIHHQVKIGPKHLDLIPRIVRATESPVSGSSLPVYVCAKESAKYVDTIFTGDAGDTLWNEYYPVAEWHKYLKHLPAFTRKFFHKLSKLAIKINDWERFWELEHTLSLFSKPDIYKNFFTRLCTYRHFNEELFNKLINPKLLSKSKKTNCMLDIPFNASNFSDALIEAKMFYGVYMYMIPPTQKPLKNLGVNFYTPYFNHELIEFITSLPENWVNGGSSFKKLRNNAIKRRFHKAALSRYFPLRQVNSLQQSFDIPFHSLLNKRPDILKNLLIRLKHRGWYDDKTLNKIFKEFPKQKVKPSETCELKHHGYRIYSLLTFEIWCMEFLDNFEYNKKEKIIPLEDYLSL